MARAMRVVKCPSDLLSMTNRVVVSPEDWDTAATPHLQAGHASTCTNTCTHYKRITYNR